jgi:hypothetical protein
MGIAPQNKKGLKQYDVEVNRYLDFNGRHTLFQTFFIFIIVTIDITMNCVKQGDD